MKFRIYENLSLVKYNFIKFALLSRHGIKFLSLISAVSQIGFGGCVLRNRFDHIKLAIRTAVSVPDFFFHLGYQQIVIPRVVRRLIARTELHRAWLSGFYGLWLCPVHKRAEFGWIDGRHRRESSPPPPGEKS